MFFIELVLQVLLKLKKGFCVCFALKPYESGASVGSSIIKLSCSSAKQCIFHFTELLHMLLELILSRVPANVSDK